MMQHHDQETRQTLPKPRPPVHERLRALAEGASKFETVFQVVTAIRVMADMEEMRWNEGMDALAADLQAIDAQGGWIGGFAPDQWQQITGALRTVYRPHMGQVPTPDELLEQLSANLNGKEAG